MSEYKSERYYQCPYCTPHESGHTVRVPKTIGKYRVKILYDDILIFTCGRCARVFRVKFDPTKLMWSNMSTKEKDTFKKEHNTTIKEVKT